MRLRDLTAEGDGSVTYAKEDTSEDPVDIVSSDSAETPTMSADKAKTLLKKLQVS